MWDGILFRFQLLARSSASLDDVRQLEQIIRETREKIRSIMNTCKHGNKLNEHCDDCIIDERDGWKSKPWFIFDTETTGVDVENDRICQLGGMWMQNGEMTDRRLVTINPGVPIPEGASNVHGITDDRVAGAPRMVDVFPKILAHFQRAEVVLSYNGSRFDWPLLLAEVKRLDAEHPVAPGERTREFELWDAVVETLFVDVLVQVRRRSVGRWWKGTGRHRLENVAQRMGIMLPPGMRAHRADADCYITGRILWQTRDKLPHTAAEVRELLDERQAEQEADYQRWRAQQDAHNRTVADEQGAADDELMAPYKGETY